MYFQALCRRNQHVKVMLEQFHRELTERSISATALITSFQIPAVKEIARIMEHGATDAIKLKAAIDLADRGPETSKIQKHQVESLTISDAEASNIRRAMIEAAKLRAMEIAVTNDNFEMVQVDNAGPYVCDVPPGGQRKLNGQ